MEGVVGMKQTNVLFIGNSFTYFNDMYRTFEAICVANGHAVHAEQIAYGGYALMQYLREEDKREELETTLHRMHWDVVVLQDQSRKTFDNLEDMRAAVAEINDLVVAQGGRTLLFATWSYHERCPMLQEMNLTYDDFATLIQDGYDDVAKTVDVEVVPVGMVFQALHRKVDLLTEDDFHPNPLGSYVIASMMYQTLFKVRNTEYVPENLDAVDRAVVENELAGRLPGNKTP
jgi:lysophospholipase L1-like esterase